VLSKFQKGGKSIGSGGEGQPDAVTKLEKSWGRQEGGSRSQQHEDGLKRKEQLGYKRKEKEVDITTNHTSIRRSVFRLV